MALTPLPHGPSVKRKTTAAIALIGSKTTPWGIVATAADADADAFPIGKPVLIDNLKGAIAKAGTSGTLSRSLRAIAEFGNSIGVVVLVAEGVGEDEADIAADQTAKVIAGIDQLRIGEQATGVQPLILAAPGLATQAVTVALESLTNRQDTFAYAKAIGETPTELNAYRGGFSGRGLMLLDDFDFLAFDEVVKAEVPSYCEAHAVGLRAWLDREIGYHKTISNVAIPGVTGMTRYRAWELGDVNTEMGLINGVPVTGAIRRNGFRFWGQRTCSDDPRFAFESIVRTDQYVRRIIINGVFPYIDQMLTPSLAKDIIESINALGRREKKDQRIAGMEAYLADGNTPDELALGKLRLGYRWTGYAPLEDLEIENVMTNEFLIDFAELALAA